MQALILATDEAGKLNALTERLPAPLLPVLNRPIMAYPLELLVRGGLRDIGVAVYNQASSIEARFATGTGSGAQLTYILQREPLGTAGSVRWAASGLQETFVVLPGDAILDLDICAALASHKYRGGIATVIVHEPRPGCPFDPVIVGADGRVTGFAGQTGRQSAVPSASVLAGTGAYILEPRIFDSIPPRQMLDLHADLLPALLASEDVNAYVAEGYWNPVHNIPAYHRAQLDALAAAVGAEDGSGGGEATAVRYVPVGDRELAPGILAGRHVSVHPSARLTAPVYIGEGCQIERDVELGPGVVLGANTIVDVGASIRNSCVLAGTYIGQLINIDGRVVRGGLVIDVASGESLRVVDPFLLGEVSPRLISSLFSRAANTAGASFLLLLLLPVLAMIALALLLTSPSSGRIGQVFEPGARVRWRRTREHEAPERQTYWVPHFRTRQPDGRPAPLGSLLERTGLHRLPAIFSVLKDDLHLVGVKPLHPWEADLLVAEWQRLPYEQPAGFTGLWYLQENAVDLDEIVAADAYYTATRSFGEDVRLLLLTPIAWAGRFASKRTNSPRRKWKRSRPQAPSQLLSGNLASVAKDVKD